MELGCNTRNRLINVAPMYEENSKEQFASSIAAVHESLGARPLLLLCSAPTGFSSCSGRPWRTKRCVQRVGRPSPVQNDLDTAAGPPNTITVMLCDAEAPDPFRQTPCPPGRCGRCCCCCRCRCDLRDAALTITDCSSRFLLASKESVLGRATDVPGPGRGTSRA